MKKKISRLSLIATGILATSGSILGLSITGCSRSVDNSIGQVKYKDLSDTTTSVTGLENAGTNVKSITIPIEHNGKKVVSIEKGALTKCPNLETIELPFIGANPKATGADGMFGYVFGEEIYDGCGTFTWQEAEDETNATTIYGQYAIPNNLSKVSITAATRIPAGAFSNCRYLENITINKSTIQTIQNKAFYNCSSLGEFDLSFSSNLNYIEHSAFEKCYTLKSITIPNTVKAIEENAFANCLSATKATIPSSVIWMESGAFSKLGGILLVESSEKQIKQQYWAEDWTESDVAIIYDFKSDSTYKYVDDWLVIICGSENNKYGYLAQWMGNWQQTAITIPGKVNIDGTEIPVKVIGGKCFNENFYIKRLTVEEGVTTIHPNVFEGCNALEYVNFPSTLTDIRDEAFKNCTALKGRYVDGLPVKGLDFANVKNIRRQAFYGCKALTDIELEKVEAIGDEAFAYCTHLCQDQHYEKVGETELHNILTIPSTCSSLGKGAFKWCFKYAPEGQTASYFYPTVWLDKGQDPAPKIKEIPESCFESCGVRVKTPTTGEDAGTVYPHYIRVSIHLGDAHLEKIGDAAFKNCYMYHLKGARYTHLKYIGNYAFYYAQMTSEVAEAGGKQELQMDQEIEYIGDYAFAYCTTVCKLKFNTVIDGDETVEEKDMHYNSLKQLGQYAFYGCNNVDFTDLDMSPCVYLQNTSHTETEETYDVTNTPRYAFAGCSYLQTVKLPGSPTGDPDTPKCTTFTRLPERMFESCTNLGRNGSEMTIPEQITDIRQAVFNGCNYLTKCYIDGTINYYGSSIFYNNYALVSVTRSDGTDVKFADDIPSSQIGSSIYYKCEKLVKAPIPVGTTKSTGLNSSMFFGNKALTTIKIVKKITSIGSNCFNGCENLKTIDMSEASDLTTIYANAFEDCKAMTAFDFSKTKISSFYDKAFMGCSGLTTITLSKGISITFNSKPFEGLSNVIIKFGKKCASGYEKTKAWDNPNKFAWSKNTNLIFTQKSGNQYTCEDTSFCGSTVIFEYDSSLD